MTIYVYADRNRNRKAKLCSWPTHTHAPALDCLLVRIYPLHQHRLRSISTRESFCQLNLTDCHPHSSSVSLSWVVSYTYLYLFTPYPPTLNLSHTSYGPPAPSAVSHTFDLSLGSSRTRQQLLIRPSCHPPLKTRDPFTTNLFQTLERAISPPPPFQKNPSR